MISHVVRRALESKYLSEVLVATDDRGIAAAAEAAGARAVMTGVCASGTDRVAEAALSRLNWDLLINVQGDEPLLSSKNIDVLIEGMAEHPESGIGTLCRPLDLQYFGDPNVVKVVRASNGRALYFSRAAIPFFREGEADPRLIRRHLGIYAYRRAALETFVALPASPLEEAEKLEQLRALEAGLDIVVFDAPDEAFGVDTPEDLKMVEKIMRERRPDC